MRIRRPSDQPSNSFRSSRAAVLALAGLLLTQEGCANSSAPNPNHPEAANAPARGYPMPMLIPHLRDPHMEINEGYNEAGLGILIEIQVANTVSKASPIEQAEASPASEPLIPTPNVSDTSRAIRLEKEISYEGDGLGSKNDILDELASFLRGHTEIEVISIHVHTDDTGNPQQRSGLRAAAVKSYLVDKGVKADRIQVKGWGDSKPIADNNNPGDKGRNNRTLIIKGPVK